MGQPGKWAYNASGLMISVAMNWGCVSTWDRIELRPEGIAAVTFADDIKLKQLNDKGFNWNGVANFVDYSATLWIRGGHHKLRVQFVDICVPIRVDPSTEQVTFACDEADTLGVSPLEDEGEFFARPGVAYKMEVDCKDPVCWRKKAKVVEGTSPFDIRAALEA